jgi:hypothetical protein
VAERNDIEVADVFTDAESGKTASRREFSGSCPIAPPIRAACFRAD